jgi:hypothetical protein
MVPVPLWDPPTQSTFDLPETDTAGQKPPGGREGGGKNIAGGIEGPPEGGGGGGGPQPGGTSGISPVILFAASPQRARGSACLISCKIDPGTCNSLRAVADTQESFDKVVGNERWEKKPVLMCEALFIKLGANSVLTTSFCQGWCNRVPSWVSILGWSACSSRCYGLQGSASYRLEGCVKRLEESELQESQGSSS